MELITVSARNYRELELYNVYFPEFIVWCRRFNQRDQGALLLGQRNNGKKR